MRTALTIAGSDSSGGAGIQADIKTMISNGVYAMSAITALTAQNTTGVTGIMEVTPEFLGEQLDNIFTDIYPDAVKIGCAEELPASDGNRSDSEYPGSRSACRYENPVAGGYDKSSRRDRHQISLCSSL